MNSKFYKCCAVPQCASTTIRTPEKLFIHVPRSSKRRKMWLQLARRDATLVAKKSKKHFCEDHFDLPSDMENYTEYRLMGSVSKVRLRAGCLPSKFGCQPDRKRQTVNETTTPLAIKRQRLEKIAEFEIKIKKSRCISMDEMRPSRSSGPIFICGNNTVNSLETYDDSVFLITDTLEAGLLRNVSASPSLASVKSTPNPKSSEARLSINNEIDINSIQRLNTEVPESLRRHSSSSSVVSLNQTPDAAQDKLCVAVVLQPFRELSMEEAEIIREDIEELIFAAALDPLSKYAPAFRGKAVHSEGALKLWCNDDDSLNWLKTNITEVGVPRGGYELAVIKQMDIPHNIRCGLLVPGYDGDIVRLHAILKAQNPWYDVGSWIIYGATSIKHEHKNALYLTLGLSNSESINIKKRNREVAWSTGALYIQFHTVAGLSDLLPVKKDQAVAVEDRTQLINGDVLLRPKNLTTLIQNQEEAISCSTDKLTFNGHSVLPYKLTETVHTGETTDEASEVESDCCISVSPDCDVPNQTSSMINLRECS